MTPEEKLKILRQRAEELSLEVDDSELEDDSINIVEFMLNDEVYAFDTIYTKQVASLKDLTTVPCTPSYVLGVAAMYEQIISVIDIRSFFQMQSKGISNLNKIIILERKNISFAIAADEVIGIKSVPLRKIQKSIDTFDDVRKKYFYGLTEDQTIILDGGKVLADQEIVVK
jgi:purine-binding chemotaxis protein CheW